MRNKPKRHKAENTFKFQTFSERISNIDIDIFHKVKHPYEEDDDEIQTYYSQCLNKLNNDNFSPSYIELRKKLPHDIFSLAQLLNQKNKIIDVLVNHIKSDEIESLSSALELLVAIAKDLNREFFPFFNPTIIRECIRLLDTKDPDQIECVFTSLAYFFKCLRPSIIKNINSVLPELLPLLSDSKPSYINNFAAESFAFVARGVRNKSQFLNLSLKNVKNNPDELLGMAKLFFEVMKSVGNQFHSRAEEFLTIILKELSNKKWSKLLFNICKHLISDLINFISVKTDTSIIWKSFEEVGNEFYLKWQDTCDDESNAEDLVKLLTLIKQLITSRKIILQNPESLKVFILKIINHKEIKKFKSLLIAAVDIISHLLTNQNFCDKIHYAEDIIREVQESIADEQVLVYFYEKIISHQQYEFHAFSEFLKFVNSNELNEHILQFLTKIIWIKTKFTFNADIHQKMNFYSVCLNSMSDSFYTHLLNCISEENDLYFPEKLENTMCAVLVLSYINTPELFVSKIGEFIMRLYSVVNDTENVEHIAKFLYISLMIFQFWIKSNNSILFNNDIIKSTMRFINSSNYLCSLRILNVLLEFKEVQYLYSHEEKLSLINNLNSPFHKVRLFTLQVLKNMELHPLFELMFQIESIVPSIDNYREKLQLLQNLECNDHFLNYVEDEFTRIGVLKFLFGNLYINFLYIWEPTQKLILSHLEKGINVWSIVEFQLKEAIINDKNSIKLMENFVVDFKNDFFKEHFYELNGVDDRPDFYNFLCLSLNILTNMKNYVSVNKYLIPELFLEFYTSEYISNTSECYSLTKVKKIKNELINVEESLDDLNINYHKENKSDNKNHNKLFIIYLKLILKLFDQLPQPLKKKVDEIYFNQLSNGNSEIQELCVIYVSKSKEITVHKDRLLLLTKEKTFKNELLNIRIDFNSDVFPEQHKRPFMEIVLKMLYGKIKKKCASQLRDSIFEFIAGCEDSDILLFFDLFFKQFPSNVKDSADTNLYYKIDIDPKNTISPSCLSSYLNTVLDLLKHCGKLLKYTCLAYLLKVLLKIMANLVAILNKRSDVHFVSNNLLSKIRVTSFETAIYFIDEFEYDWTEDEIFTFLKLFVEPWIEKVPEECLQSPNSVMKLFISFTKNTRYFPLLVAKCGNLYPLEVIINLLNSKKVYVCVKNVILEIIERLLTLEDNEVTNHVSDLIYVDSVNEIKQNQRYGYILLMPYVQTILEYLQKQFTKKFIKLEGIHMLILNRISAFALTEESSITLLTLLMPVLKIRATANDDTILPFFHTIFNLFKTINNPYNFENYLLQIAYLFNVVDSMPVRRVLCDLTSFISQRTENKFINAELILGLNLVNKNWLEEPDYAGRLQTFKKIKENCENGELNIYTGIFIIYNCVHTLKTVKDIALRDHSGLCLKIMCPTLCQKYSTSDNKWLNILLNVVLLPLIKEGIRANNENYKEESIMLLGQLVRECNALHFVFKNLYILSDKLNIENDFFENIQHLQHYRRIMALKRFNEIMSQEIKTPQPYSLTFIFPLVTQFLLSSKYSNEHGLINCAVDALKIICRLCPWHQYEKILKQFIIELRKNMSLRKQAVRIVSAILDSFHFDISQAGIKEIDEYNKKMADNIKNENQDHSLENINMDTNDIMDMNDTTHTNEKECANNIEKKCEPAVTRITVLCRSDALRIFRSVKSFLIPSLDRAFMTYEESNQYHNLNKKGKNNNEEEMAVLSIPISYAIVKLLNRISHTLLDEYVSTVFLKLSTYLKSRLPSIRQVARETMQNIIVEVGPSYLHRLLSEMMSILTKGFQIHVLVSTSHAILEKVECMLSAGDIDACIDPILEICIVDLFGKVADEKEVEKISNKIPEARGNISYNMLRIISEYVSEDRILDLVLPLKEIISTNLTSKTMNKVRRCLHYIATGLVHNKSVSSESLLVFSFGVSNDCIPALVAERENNIIRTESEVPLQKSDTFLIPEEPRHMQIEKRKICSRTNAHVIIAFGLELLTLMLKRETVMSSFYRSYLDPFIPLINDCLRSQHSELTVLSLKCLTRLLKRDLPSLNGNVPQISDSVFLLMGKYSGSGMTAENAEILMATTKVAQVLIRDLKHKINNQQLRILLFVVEDLQKNKSHYATAFSLLGSIIERRYNILEFHQLMQTVAEQSIKSNLENIRLMARKAFYHYLMNYPHGKKLRQYVLFYTSQLKYEEISGRLSALEMLREIVHVFPTDVLSNLSSLLYVQLSFRLILDNSPECKKIVADCIFDIISRIQNTKEVNDLYNITLIWMKEKKALNRKLAVQLLKIFVSVEKEKFENKFNDVLPLMQNQLHDSSSNQPGKFVKPFVVVNATKNVEKDQLVYQVLQFYETLFQVFEEFLQNKDFSNYVREIGDSCHILLRHSHEWVRLKAIQVLGIIFKSINVVEISSIINKTLPFESGFLRDEHAKDQIKILCLDLCDQFAPGVDVMEELLKAVVVNLLFLAEVLQHIPNPKNKTKLSLLWLVKKLVKQIRLEVLRTPQKYSVRVMILNWFAALAVKLESDKLVPLLPTILEPVLRELSITDEQGVKIRQIAKEVLQYYRQKINSDNYDKVIVDVQRILDVKRAKRKMKITQMNITDPERAAKRKMKIQLKKKEQKKRKLEKLRKRKFKSGKRKPIEIKND